MKIINPPRPPFAKGGIGRFGNVFPSDPRVSPGNEARFRFLIFGAAIRQWLASPNIVCSVGLSCHHLGRVEIPVHKNSGNWSKARFWVERGVRSKLKDAPSKKIERVARATGSRHQSKVGLGHLCLRISHLTRSDPLIPSKTAEL